MPKFSKIIRIIFLIALFINLTSAFALSSVSEEFAQKIRTLKWIAYSPTNFDPDDGIYPTEDSIRKDLSLLYKYGFRGVVTYGSHGTLAEIPWIAAEIGFKGIIMGIWDIRNEREIENAVAAKKYVDGYCVGNEGLNSRYDLDTLKNAIEKIKLETEKLATTTEEIQDYYNNYLDLLSVGDWVFPNVHPFLNKVKDPIKAVKWVEKHYRLLKKHSGDKILLIKETGFPTKGAQGATESNQTKFYLNLEKTDVSFVYFEAFDQIWKTDTSVEPHWGLFNHHRKPKQYISLQKNS